MRILIVRLGSLGDIVHTVPAQQYLAKRYPEAEIHWLVEPPYDQLLNHVPNIEKLWKADTKRWRKDLTSLSEPRALVSELRAQRFDLAIDFQGLVKSALLCRLSGARRIIGYQRKWLREPLAAWFYNEPTQIEDGQRHHVEYLLDLADPPRFQAQVSADMPLAIPADASRYVAKHLDRLQVKDPILLNPGAGWETKRWPAERFAQLGEVVQETLGIPVIITCGPAEQDLLDTIQERTLPDPLKAFPTDLLQLAALCRKSRLMVAGDTGPLHLAVALGLPTVAILGPAHAWRTGPFSRSDVIVQHERTCPHPYKRTCSEHFCMDISVEQVFSGITERLGL
ncbi:MAG TPA: glycosyltransferase family 9 protein [Acidobacteriota bacterium]|nr:glycosyltransferase family 9 protein [Acidobacteriota bacterium]